MSGGSFQTIVCKDGAEVALRVARGIADLSRSSLEPPITIALSGGSTPKQLYETLVSPPLRDEVRWERLELFFGDERAAAPDHPDSNWGTAERALFTKVAVRAHRMKAERGEADAYEKVIRERVTRRTAGNPSFDLVLLGMGADGHTASLFPGTAALEERERLVVMNEVPQLRTRRMTVTFPLLEAAARIWVMIAGADKQGRVAECLAARERGEAPYPVLRAVPQKGELIWWLDEAAFPKGTR